MSSVEWLGMTVFSAEPVMSNVEWLGLPAACLPVGRDDSFLLLIEKV